MLSLGLPLILYGAGGRSAWEKEQAELNGFNPVCFVDVDVKKQNKEHLGLPVLSLEQAKTRYGKFYVHITPGWELHGEIFSYLLENGITEDRILNFMEMCYGCVDLDSKMVIEYKEGHSLNFCCTVNDNMKQSPYISLDENNWNMEKAVSEYINTRNRLAYMIKTESANQCSGCIQIKRDYRPVNKKVKILNFAFHDPCQLSCIYCRIKKHNVSDFDYRRFIEILEQKELLASDAVISLAMGEVTINPRIEEILDAVQSYRLGVFTNAIVYNERLATLTARPGGGMQISVDAGTSSTYELVKGKNVFDRVWGNIRKYVNSGVLVSIKYVFVNENSNEADVDGFIHEAVKAGVHEILISADYFREPLSTEQLVYIAKMINMADRSGVQWSIVPTFKQEEEKEILRLKELGKSKSTSI